MISTTNVKIVKQPTVITIKVSDPAPIRITIVR
jgi:hypothetical protein